MTKVVPQLARPLGAALAMLLVFGCAGRDPSAVDDPLKLRNLSITMDAGANGNRPARVALVRVRDARLVPQLVAIGADAWFGDEGEAFRNANPKAVYDRWEPVPGLISGPHRVKHRGKFAGVLFCQTQASPPPFRVERDGDLRVLIDDSGCRIEGGKPRRSMFGWLRRPKTVEFSFAVPAEKDLNHPVQVELVRAPDADVVRSLERLTGSAWFGEGGRTFRRDHPNALIDDWELVPGGAYGPFQLAIEGNEPGLLFCGKAAAPPLRVEWSRRVEVEVASGGCRFAQRVGSRWRWNPLTWGGWK